MSSNVTAVTGAPCGSSIMAAEQTTVRTPSAVGQSSCMFSTGRPAAASAAGYSAAVSARPAGWRTR